MACSSYPCCFSSCAGPSDTGILLAYAQVRSLGSQLHLLVSPFGGTRSMGLPYLRDRSGTCNPLAMGVHG